MEHLWMPMFFIRVTVSLGPHMARSGRTLAPMTDEALTLLSIWKVTDLTAFTQRAPWIDGKIDGESREDPLFLYLVDGLEHVLISHIYIYKYIYMGMGWSRYGLYVAYICLFWGFWRQLSSHSYRFGGAHSVGICFWCDWFLLAVNGNEF